MLVYSGDLKKLETVLDDRQKMIYKKIKNERLHHFYMGLGVGAVLGLFILISDIKMTSKYCLAGLILLLSTSMVYVILPKSDYMINHLETLEKKQKWKDITQIFFKKMATGFVLAFIIYFSVPMFL